MVASDKWLTALVEAVYNFRWHKDLIQQIIHIYIVLTL